MAAVAEITLTAPGNIAGLRGMQIRPEIQWESGREFQDLKIDLHRKLMEVVTPDQLSGMGGERARAELRIAISAVVERQRLPLGVAEKERVVDEMLEEVYGLAIRTSAGGSHGFGHSGYNPQDGLRGAGGQVVRNGGGVPRRRSPAGWLPRERGGSAGRGGRPDSVDPALRQGPSPGGGAGQ